ncbi:arsC family protein [Paraburkholderia xenovorans LB400]|uniref:Nitrogenase-associated protein n=1 Tax=Paraburkholderia xenovorans (strain LB400) TaxID=266265 RepID=Q13N35_PARXL|nr:ArsC/Spx/MgsR family protein [Paraburkholderia xenovorans]ABE34504.1 Nitrogenase-associated protein [Paraburkholderia xenovorans LB400]AIP35441.1 arsC family protein [Paraburkholderia xenovorans LB400]
MAHLVFYEKPGCAGNGRQKALLRAAGHTLDVRDLLSWPWSADALLAFIAPLPVSEWFNRAAPRIKSGEIVPETLDADTALALLLAGPLLIRRPLMQCDARRMVGFDAAEVHAWVGLGAQPPAPGSPLEGCAATAAHGTDQHADQRTEQRTDQRTTRCTPST